MNNQEIRDAMNHSGIKQWQVAEAYGIHEGNFSRKLRHELSEDERMKILAIIQDLKDKR
ncbi:MAG: hypothetical protein MJ124_07755 [Lachnospiraceae bacterium]|nr:hypothetical protein [Lachnospiraceae bacterium]